MLAWLVEEVASPYGDVATLHWAVPDDDDAEGGDGGLDTLNSTEMQVELESAEDQLGAVLWNSNPAALSYLHTHIFGLAPVSELSSSTPLRDKSVVELGAGVGCLGLALAMAGARVAITDLKELLPLMEYNVRLNAKRVQARSHGVGLCTALQWKWGPTVSTAVHKQMQKELKGGSKGKGGESNVAAVAQRVLTAMASAMEAPSSSLTTCSAALCLSSSPSPPAVPYHYAILCDALYGNPKDWPALLYTLTEIMCSNPEECEIVNFCEQRVDDVEGAFLKLLDAENAKVYVSAAQREAHGVADPLWSAAVDCAVRCAADGSGTAEKKGPSSGATSSSQTAVEQHKAREDAAAALLSYVLVQRRRGYRWAYATEVVPEAQSELNMVIRATRIRWICENRGKPSSEAATPAADPNPRRRSREGETGGAAKKRKACE